MIEYTVKVEYNGDTFWYINGKLHREDGPAVEWANGSKEWYLNGGELTEEQHKIQTSPVKDYTVTEISKLLGHNVRIVKE